MLKTSMNQGLEYSWVKEIISFLDYYNIFQDCYILILCLKSQPVYTYKCYPYKKTCIYEIIPVYKHDCKL